MDILKDRFIKAASELEIPQEKMDALWQSLEQEKDIQRTSTFSMFVYYFGALIVILAMTWLMDLGWDRFGGGGIFCISVIYACIFFGVGSKLWSDSDLRIPSGLLITAAVCMTPIAIYGLEEYFQLWTSRMSDASQELFYLIQINWILMELGTIFVGALVLSFFSFPFLSIPIFYSVWFLLLDGIPLLLGRDFSWEKKSWLSMGFGIAVFISAYFMHRYKKPSHSGRIFLEQPFYGLI